jgi:hypothetical protein
VLVREQVVVLHGIACKLDTTLAGDVVRGDYALPSDKAREKAKVT